MLARWGSCPTAFCCTIDSTVGKKAETKRKRERSIVQEFLDHAKIPYQRHDMRSIRERTGSNCRSITGPDVSVTCELAGAPKRIGIELAEYQNDVGTAGKGSLGRRVDKCFRTIRESLRRRQYERAKIRQVVGMVLLDRKALPRMDQCEEVAAELIRFVEANLSILSPDQEQWFNRSDGHGGDADFVDYPLLTKHFKRLMLEIFGGVGPIGWTYDSASSVGIVRETVVGLINGKASKLPSYDKSNTDETWLLICAGLALPTDSAGPRQHGQRYLAATEIRRAAAQSGFDKVIFWERVHGWHEYLT